MKQITTFLKRQAPTLAGVLVLIWVVLQLRKVLQFVHHKLGPHDLIGFLADQGIISRALFQRMGTGAAIYLIGGTIVILTVIVLTKLADRYAAVRRIPVFGFVYGGVKTLVNREGPSGKVVVFEFTPGNYKLGILTGLGEPTVTVDGSQLYTIFEPSGPVPASGVLHQVPKEKIWHTGVPITDFSTFVITLGNKKIEPTEVAAL